MKRTPRSLVPVVIVSALLAGCASAPRGADTEPPGPSSHDASTASAMARPLAAPAAAGEHAVSQVVRGAFGPREMTLNCVVSVKGGVMSVVGLNAMGVRLFTIGYDGAQVSVEKSPGVPDALTPERLLADLQLVFWPLDSLQKALKPAGYEVNEPAPGTRRLRRAERLIAEAHYGGADPWSGRAWLVNVEHGYSLQIDSQAP